MYNRILIGYITVYDVYIYKYYDIDVGKVHVYM